VEANAQVEGSNANCGRGGSEGSETRSCSLFSEELVYASRVAVLPAAEEPVLVDMRPASTARHVKTCKSEATCHNGQSLTIAASFTRQWRLWTKLSYLLLLERIEVDKLKLKGHDADLWVVHG
jgi:hypothetical protein